MPFEKGNTHGKGMPPKVRKWTEAIEIAIKRRNSDDPQALSKLAEKLIQAAEQGDMAALKEIGDRLEGKAAQAIEHSGDVDMRVTKIERVVIDPKD